MGNDSGSKGALSEGLALAYLQQNGLLLVSRNFYSRFGEIDLIMMDGDVLVFIEVKLRKSGINSGIESITYSKQKKLVKTASYYLMKLGRDILCRFDAVILDGNNNYEWLKNIIVL